MGGGRSREKQLDSGYFSRLHHQDLLLKTRCVVRERGGRGDPKAFVPSIGKLVKHVGLEFRGQVQARDGNLGILQSPAWMRSPGEEGV